jgi:(R,R)-butanediol dehydrogenase/meso-butanediol dehydrogenase/diacetyl reductase
MKAARWYGKNDVRIDEVKEPVINKDEVKIKVKWCGFCGTDVHEYMAGPIFIPAVKEHPVTNVKAPVTLGHEYSGEVVEVGANVTNLKVGDRVVTEPLIPCGECESCKKGLFHICESVAFEGLASGNGGFGEYTKMHQDFVHKLPDNVSYEMGAFVEPFSVAVHSVEQGRFKIGQTGLVVGAGPIGLATIESLKIAGAKTIIAVEISPIRKENAKRSGADYVLDPTQVDVIAEVKKITGAGVDVAFEVTGVQAGLDTCIDATKTRGIIVNTSIWEKPVSIDLNKLVGPEKTIVGTICYNENFPATIQYMSDGRIKAAGWATKRIHLDDIIEDGFKTLASNEKEKHVKIIVTPDRSLLD